MKQKVIDINRLKGEGELKKFYAEVNIMKRAYQPRLNAFRDVTGEILTNNGKILN